MTAARRDAPCGAVVSNEYWRVASFDPVVGVEDRRVNDRPEPLTRRVRRTRRNQRVDEDLIPFQHLVDAGGRLRRLLRGLDGSRTKECQRNEKDEPSRLCSSSASWRPPIAFPDELTCPFPGRSVPAGARLRFSTGRVAWGYNRGTQPSVIAGRYPSRGLQVLTTSLRFSSDLSGRQ